VITFPDGSTIDTLEVLRNSTINFHLTGSHFFHSATVASDIDFFAQDDEKTAKFLVDCGFKRLETSSYIDTQTTAVFRKGSIDVQLVRDVALKDKVQEKIKALFPKFPHLTKLQQCEIWESGFLFVK